MAKDLRQAVPGAAAVHHARAVRNLLDSSGVRYIYLPPYSPDLNEELLAGYPERWGNLVRDICLSE